MSGQGEKDSVWSGRGSWVCFSPSARLECGITATVQAPALVSQVFYFSVPNIGIVRELHSEIGFTKLLSKYRYLYIQFDFVCSFRVSQPYLYPHSLLIGSSAVPWAVIRCPCDAGALTATLSISSSLFYIKILDRNIQICGHYSMYLTVCTLNHSSPALTPNLLKYVNSPICSYGNLYSSEYLHIR